jgi:hypothetical protein
MDRTIHIWGSMEGIASQPQILSFVIYLKRERERECRNWKDDLVTAIEMRERESVCGGILL